MKSLLEKYMIIKLKKEGKSDSQINREHGVSRTTIRKYWREYLEAEQKLLQSNPDINVHDVIESIIDKPNYDVSSRRPLKYTAEIDAALRKILDDEKKKTELLGPTHKQALTNKQIHCLLVKQGFDIGLTTISSKINEIRDEKKETFIKQEYEYCDRFEYDFGEVHLIIDGKKTKGYMAVMSAPASGFRWAYLYNNSRMAVFLDSQVSFFDMLGGCFKEGVYDNMRNVVSKFIGRNEKELNEQLVKLSLYYGFKINVTNCFSGNEKGTVESAVKWIRNKVFSINYTFDSMEDANQYLQSELVDMNKDSRIEEEKKHLTPYRSRYEVASVTQNRVDKYSFIHVDSNCYSVPEDLCEKAVTVKTYPKEIVVMYKSAVVARHSRRYTKNKTYIDIRHYLHTLTKKPGALRNSAALKYYPELKYIFDTYYIEKPKTFIYLLKEYQYMNDKDLIKTLSQFSTTDALNTSASDDVADKTNEEICKIENLFIGGDKLVN